MIARAIAVAVVVASALCACGDFSAPESTFQINSSVAQGPLVVGSPVTVAELDAGLSRTGSLYLHKTDSSLGTFKLSDTFNSPFVEMTAEGEYIDFYWGEPSSRTIMLKAISDLSTDRASNINVLTTLSRSRILYLVANKGLSFGEARRQAEAEVLRVFNIHDATGIGTFNELDLANGREGDSILAAITQVVEMAGISYKGGEYWGAGLYPMLADFEEEFSRTGGITSPDIISAIAHGEMNATVEAPFMAPELNDWYASFGVAYTTADIANWLDGDGDGLLGKFEFRVPSAAQASSFSFPTSITDRYAGTAISVSNGQFAVNGIAHVQATVIKAGDIVSVTAPTTTFPDGVFTVYLLSGATKVADASFVRGLLSIEVLPATATLSRNNFLNFKARGTYSDGYETDVTSSASWRSSAPSVMIIGSNDGRALAGSQFGEATIIASLNGISGSAIVSVLVVPPGFISISPKSTGPGIARQLSASAVFDDGTSEDLNAWATWSSSNPSVATVAGRQVTGLSVGTSTMSVTVGAAVATADFSVVSGVWSRALNNSRASGKAVLLGNGKVLTVSSDPMLYDFLTDSWSPGGQWVGPKSLSGFSATLLRSGQVVVAGGASYTTSFLSSAAVEIYDPEANAWTSAASMAQPRDQHSATLLPSGKVLVVGGSVNMGTGVALASAEIYDPVANSWSRAASMAATRSGHSAVLLQDGRVLVLGGGSRGYEIYDSATDTWSPIATPVGMQWLSGEQAVMLGNGKVLITGDCADGASPTPTFVACTVTYDPVNDSWSAGTPIPSQRYGHRATLLPNGKVLVTGGRCSGCYYPFADCWFYDPAADTWSPAPSLTERRSGHSAVMWPNGVVLVIGGTQGQSAYQPGPVPELYW